MSTGLCDLPFWQLGGYRRHAVVEENQHYRGLLREKASYSNDAPIKCIFQYTFSGNLHVRLGKEIKQVSTGYAFLYCVLDEGERWVDPPPHTPYVFTFVNLYGAGLTAHWQALRDKYGSVVQISRQSEVFDALTQMLRAHELQLTRTRCARCVFEFVMTLQDYLERTKLESAVPVQQAIECVLRNPYQDWSIKKLAYRFGISREHFTRCFKEKTGDSPANWLREEKVARAVRLLKDTDVSLQQVVKMCGMTSLDLLERLIRKRHGCSPTALRNTSSDY